MYLSFTVWRDRKKKWSLIFDSINKSNLDGIGHTSNWDNNRHFLDTQWFECNSFSSQGTINHVRLTVFIVAVSADRAPILIAVSRFRNHKPRLILAVSQLLVIYDSRIQTRTDVIRRFLISWYRDNLKKRNDPVIPFITFQLRYWYSWNRSCSQLFGKLLK